MQSKAKLCKICKLLIRGRAKRRDYDPAITKYQVRSIGKASKGELEFGRKQFQDGEANAMPPSLKMKWENLAGVVTVMLLIIALLLYLAGIETIAGFPLAGAGQFAGGYLIAGNFPIGIFSFGIYAAGLYAAQRYIRASKESENE